MICIFIVPDKAFLSALFSGALATLLFHVTLTILEKRIDRLYAVAEKQIKSPIVYQTRGEFTYKDAYVPGAIYFCQDRITFISVNVEPNVFDELLKDDIETFEFKDTYIEICTKDGRRCAITPLFPQEVAKELKNIHWFK